jgi:flagellar biosynthesis GTPase FlhF
MNAKYAFLEIEYQSYQFSPKEVRDTLLELLSGKPIVIHHNNFQFFEKLFEQLGNRDFHLFFNHKIPEEPTNFYLSIHSLKLPKKKFLESITEKFCCQKKSIFSIPKGIFHLFFPDETGNLDNLRIDSLHNKDIIREVDFLVKFVKGHFSLPTPSQIQLLTIFQFHQDILSSYLTFFFPNKNLVNISQKEFENLQQTLTNLENQNHELQNQLSNAAQFINNQAEQISQFKKDKEELENQNKEFQNQLSEAVQFINKQEQQLSQFESNREELENQNKEFQNQLSEAAQFINNQAEQISHFENNREELGNQNQELQIKLSNSAQFINNQAELISPFENNREELENQNQLSSASQFINNQA